MKSQDESKNLQIGKNILTEDDLLIQVPYEDEVFVLKYPNPMQKGAIEVEVVRRLGGFQRTSFSNDHLIMTQAVVTVEALYVPEKCPKWFIPWQCIDERLILALYNGYLSFRDEFGERLRTGKYRRGN
jgi:hypothetical protein